MSLGVKQEELKLWICSIGESFEQVPVWQGKENTFVKEKEAGRATVNRAHDFSLSESLPGPSLKLKEEGVVTYIMCY